MTRSAPHAFRRSRRFVDGSLRARSFSIDGVEFGLQSFIDTVSRCQTRIAETLVLVAKHRLVGYRANGPKGYRARLAELAGVVIVSLDLPVGHQLLETATSKRATRFFRDALEGTRLSQPTLAWAEDLDELADAFASAQTTKRDSRAVLQFHCPVSMVVKHLPVVVAIMVAAASFVDAD